MGIEAIRCSPDADLRVGPSIFEVFPVELGAETILLSRLASWQISTKAPLPILSTNDADTVEPPISKRLHLKPTITNYTAFAGRPTRWNLFDQTSFYRYPVDQFQDQRRNRQ